MDTLENFLDNHNNQTIDINIYDKYKEFNYEDESLYKLHLNFMLKNIYNIKLTGISNKRLDQYNFRKSIIDKFNHRCIITGETCEDELTAAHIIPVHHKENYDISKYRSIGSPNQHK